MLNYLLAFIMAVYLAGCGPSSTDSNNQILDCKNWVNDDNVDFLTKFSQQKQMSSSVSNDSKIEEDISYELFLVENAVMSAISVVVTPTSVPMSDIKERGYTGAFSGFLSFTPKESGSYHVMVSQKVWIDFIGPNVQIISSTAHTEEECHNDIIYKVVQFPLEKDKQYILYLVNAKTSSLKAAIKKR